MAFWRNGHRLLGRREQFTSGVRETGNTLFSAKDLALRLTQVPRTVFRHRYILLKADVAVVGHHQARLHGVDVAGLQPAPRGITVTFP